MIRLKQSQSRAVVPSRQFGADVSKWDSRAAQAPVDSPYDGNANACIDKAACSRIGSAPFIGEEAREAFFHCLPLFSDHSITITDIWGEMPSFFEACLKVFRLFLLLLTGDDFRWGRGEVRRGVGIRYADI